MSFSSDVRNEIARFVPPKVCCRKAELSALLLFSGHLEENAGDITLKVIVENAATARKVFQYLKDLGPWTARVESQQRKGFKKSRAYEVVIPLESQELMILDDLGLNFKSGRRHLPWNLLNRTCCRRSFLRGLFLSRGFISRPEGNYHLELILNDTRLAGEVQRLLHRLALEARQIERKNHLVIYIKDSEKIVDFLRSIGANKALLDFENVRILKSMRNAVNRQVNCETANLAKTIDAALRQVELMKRLIHSPGWDQLSLQMKELAYLRMEHPDCNLKELGEMLNPPLSKSGTAYRMRKLEKAALDLLNRKEPHNRP